MINTTDIKIQIGDQSVGLSRIRGPHGHLWIVKVNGRSLRVCDEPSHARTFFFFKIRELKEGVAA